MAIEVTVEDEIESDRSVGFEVFSSTIQVLTDTFSPVTQQWQCSN
jgi:hypothetical protein